ncbi:MAG TPA: ATP-binding protein [Caulobacteraceae bacterium]
MYRRLIEPRVREALADTPVVLLIGPRRAGKTTLVRSIEGDARHYLTLDDQTALDAARADPVGFVRGLDLATIDEIQRAPDLLLAIKKTIDEDRRPGRFLLTGSANVMTLPKVADSLAGRIEIIRMMPLAHAEVEGRTSKFLEKLFAGKSPAGGPPVVGQELVDLALAGGFPEAIARDSERRRLDWARSYLTSILTRDLRDIAEVERLTDLPRFVRLLAEHSGQLVNYSTFGGAIDVNYKTAQRYVRLLEQVFLVLTLQPWFTNAIKRVVKTPKLHFLDTGVLAAARGLSSAGVLADCGALGSLLDTFVVAEVIRLMTWSDQRLTPYHFRDVQGREVDLVLERTDGSAVGIEVKASATVRAADFAGLKALAQSLQDRFAFGVVLHDGDAVTPFGDKLAAAPISSLWN